MFVICQEYAKPHGDGQDWLHTADGRWFRRISPNTFATEAAAQQAIRAMQLTDVEVKEWLDDQQEDGE